MFASKKIPWQEEILMRCLVVKHYIPHAINLPQNPDCFVMQMCALLNAPLRSCDLGGAPVVRPTLMVLLRGAKTGILAAGVKGQVERIPAGRVRVPGGPSDHLL